MKLGKVIGGALSGLGAGMEQQAQADMEQRRQNALMLVRQRERQEDMAFRASEAATDREFRAAEAEKAREFRASERIARGGGGGGGGSAADPSKEIAKARATYWKTRDDVEKRLTDPDYLLGNPDLADLTQEERAAMIEDEVRQRIGFGREAFETGGLGGAMPDPGAGAAFASEANGEEVGARYEDTPMEEPAQRRTIGPGMSGVPIGGAPRLGDRAGATASVTGGVAPTRPGDRAGASAAAAPSGPPQVSTRAEYDRLPAGAQYLDPEGNLRVKGG